MQPVGEAAAQQIVAALEKCGGDAARVRGAQDAGAPLDGLGENLACFGRGDFEIGDEQDEFQRSVHLAPQRLRTRARDGEAAECRGRGVVGMAFEFRAQFVEFVPPELGFADCLEPVQDAEPHRHTAAEPPRPRHLALDVPRKPERLDPGGLEEKCRSIRDDLRMLDALCTLHGHEVRDAQRDTEAVVAGAEIGGRRRHACGHDFHRTHETAAGACRSNVESVLLRWMLSVGRWTLDARPAAGAFRI